MGLWARTDQVYDIYHWGEAGALFMSEKMSGLVSQQHNRHCSFGDAYIVHKNTLEKARLSTLPTPPAESARALALAIQGHNTRDKGLGEDLNENGQGQAQKVTS